MGKRFEPQNLSELKDNLIKYTSPPDTVVPRGKVVNVFITIKALEPLLIRTEGQGDITTFRIGNVSVPAILNTKMQAMLRRKTLQILRSFYDTDSEVKKHVEGLVGGEWKCMASVTAGGATVGYCGKCPACMIYGFAVQGGSYNVKSRVEGDVYYATSREEDSTYTFTRNAVDEALHVTGQALLQERAVKPGTLFVGKIALKNLTINELLLVLYSIVSIDRLGATQTHFGRVEIDIAGIIAGLFEAGSGYEAASKILASSPKDLGDVVKIYKEYIADLGGKTPYSIYTVSAGLKDMILREMDLKRIVMDAWNDANTKLKAIEKLVGGGKKGRR